MNKISYSLAAALIAIGVSTTPMFAHARGNTAAPESAAASQERAKHRAERLAKRLEEMARRLNITPAQQDEWNVYVNAVTPSSNRPTAPAGDADAVTVMRFRAEALTNMARRMTEIADATERLSAALTPEQRDTFNKMVRREDRHRRAGMAHGHR